LTLRGRTREHVLQDLHGAWGSGDQEPELIDDGVTLYGVDIGTLYAVEIEQGRGAKVAGHALRQTAPADELAVADRHDRRIGLERQRELVGFGAVELRAESLADPERARFQRERAVVEYGKDDALRFRLDQRRQPLGGFSAPAAAGIWGPLGPPPRLSARARIACTPPPRGHCRRPKAVPTGRRKSSSPPGFHRTGHSER